MVTEAMKLKDDFSLEEKLMTNLDSILKGRHITLPTKVFRDKAMVFSSHVWMWTLDHKEGWAPKNWCFWTVVLDKTLESPLDYKEIKPVNPKENQPWIFTGRTDDEAEAPILWLSDVKKILFVPSKSLWWVWNLILTWLCSSYHFAASFSFVP